VVRPVGSDGRTGTARASWSGHRKRCLTSAPQSPGRRGAACARDRERGPRHPAGHAPRTPRYL